MKRGGRIVLSPCSFCCLRSRPPFFILFSHFARHSVIMDGNGDDNGDHLQLNFALASPDSAVANAAAPDSSSVVSALKGSWKKKRIQSKIIKHKLHQQQVQQVQQLQQEMPNKKSTSGASQRLGSITNNKRSHLIRSGKQMRADAVSKSSSTTASPRVASAVAKPNTANHQKMSKVDGFISSLFTSNPDVGPVVSSVPAFEQHQKQQPRNLESIMAKANSFKDLSLNSTVSFSHAVPSIVLIGKVWCILTYSLLVACFSQNSS
jgi:hypothetical protein